MKIHVIPHLILAAALSAFALVPLSAASKNPPSIAYSVVTVNATDNYHVARGDTRSTVTRAMGESTRRVTPDVWIYPGYQADDLDQANIDGCHTLVITFADNRISDMKLVNRRAARVIAASSSQSMPTCFIAAE